MKISYKVFYEISFYSKSHQSPMNDSIMCTEDKINISRYCIIDQMVPLHYKNIQMAKVRKVEKLAFHLINFVENIEYIFTERLYIYLHSYYIIMRRGPSWRYMRNKIFPIL